MIAHVRPRSLRESCRVGSLPRSNRAARAAAILALAAACLLADGRPSLATPIVYTEAGTISGSIGSTTFTEAATTLTVVGDTASVISTTSDGLPIYEYVGTTTIQIAGVGTATFNGGDSFGAFSQYDSSTTPGTDYVGIADFTQDDAILANAVSTLAFYNLSTPYTSMGVGLDYQASSGSTTLYPTTLGDLEITGVGSFATFTASVPEPSSLVLAGIAAAAGLGLRWRRRRG